MRGYVRMRLALFQWTSGREKTVTQGGGARSRLASTPGRLGG